MTPRTPPKRIPHTRARDVGAQLVDLVRAIVREELDRDASGTCEEHLESSDADRFFAERCSFGVACRVDTSALRQAYEAWCRAQGLGALRTREFARLLEERACEPGKSDGKRVWKGVCLLEEPEGEGTSGDHGADPSRPSAVSHARARDSRNRLTRAHAREEPPSPSEQLLAHYVAEHERITEATLTLTAAQQARVLAFCENLVATTPDLDEAKSTISDRIARAQARGLTS